MTFRVHILLVFLLAIQGLLCSQTDIMGHSHNDYKQKNPLSTALELGFQSIEVDIIRYKTELKVSHDKLALKRKSTIKELYLDPLAAHITSNPDLKIWLLVDIKKYDDEVLNLLHLLLAETPDLYQTRGDTGGKPIKIILSGDFPRRAVADNKEYKYFFIDGRMGSLSLGYESTVMPLISIDLSKATEWEGRTAIKKSDRNDLRQLIARVHGQEKMLRFWATPDDEVTWQTLLDLGVDIIGVDKLEEFAAFRAQLNQ